MLIDIFQAWKVIIIRNKPKIERILIKSIYVRKWAKIKFWEKW